MPAAASISSQLRAASFFRFCARWMARAFNSDAQEQDVGGLQIGTAQPRLHTATHRAGEYPDVASGCRAVVVLLRIHAPEIFDQGRAERDSLRAVTKQLEKRVRIVTQRLRLLLQAIEARDPRSALMSVGRSGKLRNKVARPTPALLAIRSSGADVPSVRNTCSAASSNSARLFDASTRAELTLSGALKLVPRSESARR